MQFAKIFASSALFAIASAVVSLTNTDFSGITAGTPFVISWTGNTGPVTLLLKSGPSSNLVTAGTITSGATGSSFSWTPTASGTFAIEIQDGADINYSSQFAVTGGTALASSSAALTSTGTVTVSSTTSVSSVTVVTMASTSAAESSTATPVSGNSTSAVTSASRTPASTTSASRAPTSSSSPININSAAQHVSSFTLAVIAFAALVGMN